MFYAPDYTIELNGMQAPSLIRMQGAQDLRRRALIPRDKIIVRRNLCGYKVCDCDCHAITSRPCLGLLRHNLHGQPALIWTYKVSGAGILRSLCQHVQVFF